MLHKPRMYSYRLQILDTAGSLPEWCDVEVIWDSLVGHCWNAIKQPNSRAITFEVNDLEAAVSIATEMSGKRSDARFRVVHNATGATAFDTGLA